MNLFAIRHTSVAVQPGICYGQSDVLPADTFHSEKKELEKHLAGIRFDKVFSSPLSRCKILAENIFGQQEIIYDDRLKELNFGDWELKAWEEIYHSPEGKTWMENYQVLPTLNGESYPEMIQRITGFNEMLVSEKCENIVVVTHAGVIRILKSIIEKVPVEALFETFKPEYGSVTEFELK